MYDQVEPSGPGSVKAWRKAQFKAAQRAAAKRGLPMDFTDAQAQRAIDSLRRRYAGLVQAQAEFTEEFGEESKPLWEAMWYMRRRIGELMAGICTGRFERRGGRTE